MALFVVKYNISVLHLLLLLLLADESIAFTRGRQGTPPSSECATSSTPTPQRPSAVVVGPLRLSKDNDRARMEKKWENMMGEDWREFRARLVAREHMEEEISSSSSSSQSSSKATNKSEEGGIFGAITSIFSRKNNNKENENDSNSSVANTNIFDGDAVGGATKFSKISASSYPCSDPFMDEEECHIIYDETNVKLDKHRWAHPLFHVEPGCILVANEKLGGVFHQTVVLIIDHHETAGSTGIVINRYGNGYW